MNKEKYKEKLNKLLEDMDTLDDAYGYYDNDEFDFDYIMQLHDIADDALIYYMWEVYHDGKEH